MTTLYLVRHGVTAHAGHRLTGWHPGVHLTDEGRRQAESVAERLARARLSAVYSSPIDRARETAAPVAARHRLEVEVREGLGEVHYGAWSNRTFKSLVRTRLWQQVQRWPSAARFPEGETLRETQARALAEIERLRAAHPRGGVCCVTHADVIKLVIAHYLGVHLDLYGRMTVDPGSISVVTISDGGPLVRAVNYVPEDVPR
ncbi:MAG: MSMEG_4193 family putative phosphomutase [Haloechinothrix sp.]